MKNTESPFTLLVCALGGEGGGVLTQWLVDVARHAGYAAQATSVPGVAQRTGATTYYVEVFPRSLADLGGRRPVFSLNPVPGALDAIVSSELLETARQIGNGMSTPERTRVITSSSRSLTVAERMQMADGRVDNARLLQVVQSASREHHVFDMAAIARECGTVVSAVMLGAIAGSGLFPFRREDYEVVVAADGGRAAQASLKGFARALEIVQTTKQQATYVESVFTPSPSGGGLGWGKVRSHLPSGSTDAPPLPNPPPRGEGGKGEWPAEALPLITLGHARVLEYQDARYADLYIERLSRVLAAERAADPTAAKGHAITTEVARWLALWMAFDDIVRVADLKSRASRWARVRAEVKAEDADLLQVWDHFKPGVPEFAALLPPKLATRLQAWDRRRIAGGKAPWALPLKVGTHGIGGMLALRTLASMKGLRARGSRWRQEQAMIDRWLDGVIVGAARGWQLGHEIAQCGRLIKGYGATNERGKENLLHVLDHLARLPDSAVAVEAIAAARRAALADEAGHALDATLQRFGAPPRPVKEQPIRFVRRPRVASTTP